MIEQLAGAFGLFFQVEVILAVAAGTFLGIVLGALPGLTAAMGIALLLPLTYGMAPVTGFGMLLGVYCGAISGGSIAAALLNIPGTPSSVATTLDAFPMTRRGEAGRALGLAIAASFFGGVASVFILSLFAPPIAEFALRFSAPEYFSLAVLGLTGIVSGSSKSILKGAIAGLIGVWISLVGADPISGMPRFTFGRIELLSGVPFLPALIGLFALSQVMSEVARGSGSESAPPVLSGTKPQVRFREVLAHWKVLVSSTLIGSGIGAVPGAGGSVASFLAYDQARRISKTPEKFGSGHGEGVIASEASNNAMTGGALIPMMALGIPGEAACAVLMGGLMIQGLQPGPALFQEQPQIVYGILMALFAANVFMLLFQAVGIRFFIRVLRTPRHLLLPLILVFCVVGAYGAGGDLFGVYVMIAFGLLGFFLNRYGFGVAPVVLGMILGDVAESNLRRSLMLHDGDLSVLLSRPISLALLILAALSLVYAFHSSRKST